MDKRYRLNWINFSHWLKVKYCRWSTTLDMLRIADILFNPFAAFQLVYFWFKTGLKMHLPMVLGAEYCNHGCAWVMQRYDWIISLHGNSKRSHVSLVELIMHNSLVNKLSHRMFSEIFFLFSFTTCCFKSYTLILFFTHSEKGHNSISLLSSGTAAFKKWLHTPSWQPKDGRRGINLTGKKNAE